MAAFALNVAQLTVYPIKGCKGIALDKARVQLTGLAYDRQWVIASPDKGGKFQSQRGDPKMALIGTSLPTEVLTGGSVPADAALTLSAAGHGECRVPIHQERVSPALTGVSVWDWQGQACDEGDEAAEWISEVLGKRLRLLRYAGADVNRSDDATTRRDTDPMWAEGHQTAFSDMLPFLLATEESLEDLNVRLKQNNQQEIPMNRFRPNITLSGCKPWEEDSWQALHMGALDFKVAMPCARCKVPTVDQATAEVSRAREPTTTMKTFRKGTQLGYTRLKAWHNNVFFGWQLLVGAEGMLSVGDEVLVTKTRDTLEGLEE